MAKQGRKTIMEEYKIKEMYADLTPLAFKFMKNCLEGIDKADKKWAVEQLNKGFAKMIPQEQKHSGSIELKWDDGDSDPVQTKDIPEEGA